MTIFPTFKSRLLATVLFICFCGGLVALSGCGPDKVSFNTLEDARTQARANADYNAAAYRAENPRFDNTWKLVGHGDSTQSPECPQGDGWATLSIMKVDGKDVTKMVLKCSTVSGALGCYTDADFVKKPFAKEEGNCQDVNKVPFPLPKVAK